MTATVDAAPQSPKASVWEDFIDIFYAPVAVFERRRDGRFWPALLVYAIGGLLLFFAFRGMWAAVTSVAMEAQFRSNPDFTPDQLAAARASSEKFAIVGGVFQSLVGFPLAAVMTAGVLWLVGKIFGATESFAQAMTISAYANIPRLLGVAVAGALFAAGHPAEVLSPYSIALSPLRFMNETAVSPIVAALASRFDLFTLWTTVLLAVGLRVMGKVSTAGAAMTAALTWLVASAFLAVSAAGQAGG